MDEQKARNDYEMGKAAMKNAMAWYGWGSPVGLGLLLVEIGVFLWILHLAGIIG